MRQGWYVTIQVDDIMSVGCDTKMPNVLTPILLKLYRSHQSPSSNSTWFNLEERIINYSR